MKVESFVEIIGSDFYAGVPDSQLKSLCNYLIRTYGIDAKHHVIAANEGNAVGMAAGYYLATGRIPVVYLQNSGEGNIINPVASLMNDNVYGIPCVFVIGWRGEPGIHDEPQHLFQGEITCRLLNCMDIEYAVIDKKTDENELSKKMKEFNKLLKTGKQVGFVIRKGAFEYNCEIKYSNDYSMTREEIIKHVVFVSEEDPVISTTGKASRELFEIRESKGQGHEYDFLTVGSMGHSSSIALEVAVQKPNKKIWIIDGDGSALMHMGSMALMGANKPKNVIHIIINNCSHETVGGQPTVMSSADICKIAEGCGYPKTFCALSFDDLDKYLGIAKNSDSLCLIEVKCAIGARDNLGRPTTTARENKERFMKYLSNN